MNRFTLPQLVLCALFFLPIVSFSQIPKITSFSPLSGAAGTSVVLTGTSFNTTIANNIVYFGAAKATVTAATATQLTVTAPTGTTYQPISVTVAGLTGYSSLPFNLTFSGPGIIEPSSFATKVDFTTGSNPYNIAIGDLDGDGKSDLVVLNYSSSTVSVFRNTSTLGTITTGSFAAKVDFTTGSSPVDAALGDFDGDGKLDIAVANYSGGTLSVFRNTSTSGTISFAAKVDFTSGSNPRGVAIGDVDGDGKPELVGANASSNNVSVFRNISTTGTLTAGSFAAKVDFTTGTFPGQVKIRDLDGDGKRELVVLNSSTSTISVFPNISTAGAITSGSFDTKVDFITVSSPNSFDIGDLDGDGKPELAIVSNMPGAISIFRNTSTLGTFSNGSFAAKVDLVTSSSPISISIGDLDGDIKPDLIVANSGGSFVSVYRNISTIGVINTSSFNTNIDFTTGTNPYDAAIGDLDGDGVPELAVANYGSTTISVLRNLLKEYPAITSFSPSSGSAGTPVVITGTGFSTTPANNIVKFGGAIATVTASTTTSVTTTVPFGASVGKVQVIIAGKTATSASNFSVPTPTITSFSPTTGVVGTPVVITGTNFSTILANNSVYFGAGKATVTAATSTQLTVTAPAATTYEPISVTVNGLITYSISPFIITFTGPGFIDAGSLRPKVDFTTGSSPYSTAIADLDGDGKSDLAAVNASSNTVSVFRNTSTPGTITTGSFANKVDFATGTSPGGIAISDLDGDGKPELVVMNQGNVSVFRNTSNPGAITAGSFAAKVDFSTAQTFTNIRIGDLDGDGKPELVITGSNSLSIFRNTSSPGVITSGSFAAKIDFTTGSTPDDIAIADLDGDRKPELVIVNLNSSTVSIFRNTSTMGTIISSSFDAKVDFTTGSGPSSVAIGDMDGDGKPDLVVGNQYNSTASVFRNISSSGAFTTGSFAAKIDFTTGGNPYSVALSDLDGDGKLDLAVANSLSNTVSVLRNTSSSGSITASSFAAKVDFTTGSTPYYVAIGDLDGDGTPELAVANYGSSTVSVLHNVLNQYPTITSFSPPSGSIGTVVTITGTNFSTTPANNVVKFGSATVTATASTSTSVTATVPFGASVGKIQVLVDGRTSISASDFEVPTPTISTFSPTSGGIGSAVVINGTNFSATAANNVVYFGATKGNVTAATVTQLTVTVPTGATYEPITVTTNGLTAYSKAPFNVTFPGPGTLETNSFNPKFDLALGANPSGVAIGDIDGDGKSELVVTFNNGTVSVFRNTSTSGAIGSSSFAPKVDFTTGGGASSVAIGDLDGDGKLDLAVVNYNSVSVFRNTSATGAINTGSFSTKVDFNTLSSPNKIYINDLDGDGKPDLIVTNPMANSFSVLRNVSTTGAFTSDSFSAKVDFATGSSISGLAVGDLDGDGKPEIVVPNNNNSSVSVFRNNSLRGLITATSFDPKVDFTVGSGSNYAAIGDLDGDGKPELIVANTFSSLYILRNTSTIGVIAASSFAAKVDFAAGSSPQGISISDLDGDAKPDLAIVNSSNSAVSLLRNTSSSGTITASSFASKIDFTTASNPNGVAIGDLDGDGLPDLAVTNSTGSSVSVLRNAMKEYPIITSFSPQAGAAGTQVIITGTNFSAIQENNIVKFNNTLAEVTNSTATSITTYVPLGASSGKIQVSLGSQTAFSPTNFIVPVPMITNFTPASGPVGTSVTINGANFNTTSANNIIYFGATRATDVSEATTTQLKVTVPTGATYQPISVLANGLMAYSPSPFIVTFAPSPSVIETNAFTSKVDLSTGTNPRSIAIGDLDGDGKADLVIANSASNTISIFRNASISGVVNSSSFETKVDFETTSGPYSLSIGDIDGDGKLDLAVTNYFSNTVSVFRNTSTPGAITSGTFAAKIDFTTGSGPYSVSIGDLDGDGKSDLAVANNSSGTISVIRNIGTPGSITTNSFAAKVDFATGSNAYEISIGDLDGDGKPELVTANSQTGTISILKNTISPGAITSGSFAPKVDFSSAFPYSISIGDIDGDAKPDLAVANLNFNIVSVFRNTTTAGTITTSSFAAKVDFTAGSSVYKTAIGDLNGDSKPELVVINNNNSTVSIFQNTSTSGAITATSFATKVDFTTGSNPLDVAIGDLDGDGLPDLVTTNNTNSVSIFRNTLKRYQTPTITNFNPRSGPVGSLVTIMGTDFSTTKEDNIVYFGATKAVVTEATATQLSVRVPTGATYQPISVTVGRLTAYSNAPFNVTFPSPSIIVAGAFNPKVDFGTGLNPRVVAVGDLDGDGKPDLVVVNNTSNTISMFRNTGTTGAIAPGSFSTKVDFETGAKPLGIAIGDLDGDGKLDVAVANFDGNTVSIFQNKSTPGAINTGSFASKVDFNTASQPFSVAIRDLNGDGKPELAATNTNSAVSNSISVFWNTSVAGQLNSSSFANKVDFVTEAGPFTLTICDLDGDGKPDLATANHNNNSISILRNISNPGPIVASSFATKVDFAGGSNPRGITSADLDGDGKPDLAIANATHHTISVYRNTCTPGVISFAGQVTFPTGTGPIEIASGDLDGDGRPELATINSNAVSVFKNTTTVASNFTSNSFATKFDFATGGGPLGLAIGDLNGDSGPELITGNISDNTVSVLQNNLPYYLNGFSPPVGIVGATVTLSGNFNPSIASNLVQFNGTNATVNLTTSTKTDLITTVPVGASSGKITITINGKTLTSATDFEIVGPTLTGFSPLFGAVGTTITISGTNFSTLAGENIIKFDNAIAQVTPISSTSLSAIVPTGATTGKIKIELQGATSQSQNEFVVLPLQITSFTPQAVAVNSTVTIIGSGFSRVTENNTVLINGEKAIVTYADPETLKVTIPSTASTGKIKVVVEGVEVTSENEIVLIKLKITGKEFPPDFIVGSSSVQATLIVNDITEVQSIKFLSKGISSKEIILTSEDVPVPTSGNTITFPIPSAKFNDPIGLQYQFSLTDKKGNGGILSDEGYTYLNYPDGSQGATIPNLIFGKGSESYQLISIPLNLAVPFALNVFEDLGPFKKNKWRLFGLNAAVQEELDGRARIELSKGYWLIARNKTDINPGGGTTPNVTEKTPFVLKLVEGWNLIGNPYNFTISWTDVLAANNNPTGVGNLKVYKAGFKQSDQLAPYSGAFVRLDGVANLDLKVPVTNKGLTGRTQNQESFVHHSIDSKDWQVNLILDDGRMHDELAGIGMNIEAKEGKDLFDEVRLPVPEGLNSFELILKELTTMKLLKDIVPIQEEYTWSGQLWSEHDVTVSWNNSYFGNNDKQLVLETSERVELTDMRKVSSIKLSTGQHRIKIHFGTNEYIKKATLNKEARVGDVFPNPLTRGESLKINLSLPAGTSDIQMQMKDMNGKNTLLSGVGKYNEGRQSIEWVADFSHLASGLYVVKISVSHAQGVSTFYKKVMIDDTK